jgi:hypothetical protein
LTVFVGLIVPFLIVDSPERAKWLSDDERLSIHTRLVADGVITATEEGDKFSWKPFFSAIFD